MTNIIQPTSGTCASYEKTARERFKEQTMRDRLITLLAVMGIFLCLTGCGGQAAPVTVVVTAEPGGAEATSEPAAAPEDGLDPFELVSQESLFAYLEDLTTIQPYSGWRSSATEGEAEALDYVASTLDGFTHLRNLGLEVERQRFSVLLATEMWENRLILTVGGEEIEVPASAIRGLHRSDAVQALRFDSDGTLNDSESNPVEARGEIILIRTIGEARALNREAAQGRIILFDYEAINPAVPELTMGQDIMNHLIDTNPAGILLMTEFSDTWESSDGYMLGDEFMFMEVTSDVVVPILYARMEDLEPAGIHSWDDLAQIETAHLVWDADVFSPGTSGNLIARIPGVDSSQSIILGAHIDSANTPGALDDGSGSAVLLEVARILNEAQIEPAVDVYLVWFGSEEIGLIGSQYFASTHQELLDQTVAMLGVDSLYNYGPAYPHYIMFRGWSYARFGNRELVFPDRLMQVANTHNVSTYPTPIDSPWPASDNYVFSGFDVPQAGLQYRIDLDITAAYRPHTPYDTMEIARQVGDGLEEMAVVALSFVLDMDQYASDLRVAPEADRRALFVASHTESPLLTPTLMIEFGMALAWEGFDVDMVPYGQPVTAADLEDADLVVVLPVYDYPTPETDPSYDEAWTESEIEALVDYVDAGGLMVLTNSAANIRYDRILDPNEDTLDMNDLASHFGVIYTAEELTGSQVQGQEHPLMSQSSIASIRANRVAFTTETGVILAEARGGPVIALVDYGDAGGQVLVLADVGIFYDVENNVRFWRDLARYAR
jgi:hypothetical protein